MRRLIIASFMLAFVLTVVPIGHQWRWCRPEFIVLLAIYWSIFMPQYFGLFSAWCVALCQDLLACSLLGFHALGMLLVVYICHLVSRRIRHYLLWHQALWVVALVAVFQLLRYWLSDLSEGGISTPLFLLPAIISGLLWPLMVVLMGRLLLQLRLTSV
ncbi:MAG: rod shape-determining protein MreD [Cellvibrionaceae bacterium]|nr:rod shape-determining protein MreD [Cellvibrionaceae bacterium]